MRLGRTRAELNLGICSRARARVSHYSARLGSITPLG
ncbi:hypothetical protein CCACVL1_09378 [Corchorus capsularis]|uniref:Uncharacterized protein n=1 Tax=Corchorus capsularis TaxID=210143 RepID=A0A1R3IWG9_COCAP|nr:hypothetical protein CCACVL1_09378 [Corchorus capsularis]